MTTATVPTNDILGEYWENDEYFYWSPNIPKLPVKMSHTVVKHLQSSNQLHLIKHVKNIAAFHDEEYYKKVNQAVFPDWNHNIWQIKKPTGAIYNELSSWFINSEFEAKFQWESSLVELERLCGKKWFNDNTVTKGLRGHLSPFYKIADYNQIPVDLST
jgi:hypothetical protein